jgi:hypothetical protein
MAGRIVLKYPATCSDCGASLDAGQPARYYGRGRVYGLNCHAKPTSTDDLILDGPRPLSVPSYRRYRDEVQAFTDVDGQYEDRLDDWARENL